MGQGRAQEMLAGDALRAVVRAPDLATRRGDVPVIDVAATVSVDGSAVSVSLVNRDPSAEVGVTIEIAVRTDERGRVHVTLPAPSHTVFSLQRQT